MKAYLDNAATTPLDQKVIDRMVEATVHFGNPSSIHSAGRAAKASVEKARKNIAQLIGAQASEIYFTSGATEANNIAIYNAGLNEQIDTIITSQFEHPSVLETCKFVAQKYNKKLDFVSHQRDGELDVQDLENKLRGKKAFVSIMHGNNEIGILNPIEQIVEICSQNDAGFHSDTVQTIGHLPINVAKCDVDFLVCSAHKLHGPKGVGFLYAKKKCKTQAIFMGGGQERGIRPGTENYLGIMAMDEALMIAHGHDHEMHENYIRILKQEALQLLIQKVPGFKINGVQNNALSTVLNVQLPTNRSLDLLLFDLDLRGVYVSGGSACSSGSIKGSYVLDQLQQEKVGPSIRLSFSRFTTIDEVRFAVDTIADILKQ